jgi:hypothetical protein
LGGDVFKGSVSSSCRGESFVLILPNNSGLPTDFSLFDLVFFEESPDITFFFPGDFFFGGTSLSLSSSTFLDFDFLRAVTLEELDLSFLAVVEPLEDASRIILCTKSDTSTVVVDSPKLVAPRKDVIPGVPCKKDPGPDSVTLPFVCFSLPISLSSEN